jgi:MFS transporter, UMF1 family
MTTGVHAVGSWLNRRSLSWVGYDIATSVYMGVVPSVLAQAYIRGLSGSFENPTVAWGILSAVAVLVSSAASLGAAVLAGKVARFTLLVCFTAALVAAMFALAWNPTASLFQASLAFIAAQSCYFAAMTIYESFLPDIVPPSGRQRLSGLGWAAGYSGGILVIAALLVLVEGRPQNLDLLALCFAVVAVIGGVLCAIVLLVMRREGFGTIRSKAGAPEIGGLFGVIRHLRSSPAMVQLLLGTMLIQVAVYVVVTFTAPIMTSRFGKGLDDLLWLLLLIHLLAVPSTLAWSHLMTGALRRAGTLFLLACWGVVLLLLAFGVGPWMPLITVTVIGCCLGATFSSLRGFLAEGVGEHNDVGLFALATTAGRIAAALGPALYTFFLYAAGEQAALLSILFILALGGAILFAYLGRPGPANHGPALR